jgi:peptidoglycan/LPS O-acetylase OafA/YrhL
MTSMSPRMPNVAALDGFRAVAVLLVMLSHAGLERVVPGGFGVTIFFFLSGYLITTLLRIEAATTGRVSLSNFYYKRTLRIFPPLYITIALVWLLSWSGFIWRNVTLSGFIADSLFLTNYGTQLGAGRGVPVPLWSLDVEEHFYILFSTLFAFVLIRMSSYRAAMTCLLIAAIVLVVRIVSAFYVEHIDAIYYWSHTRVDSILWGSILALYNNPVSDECSWKPSQTHLVLALGALLMTFILRSPLFRETIRYSVQGMSLFVVFSYTIHDCGFAGRIMSSRVLRYIALLSYTLYLGHMPALLVAERFGAPIFAGFALAFVYAILMYLLVEKPLAGLRRRPVLARAPQ